MRILHALEGRSHPPWLVAEVIETALVVARPRVRYPAGREVALLRAAGAFVPPRSRDVAVRAVLSLWRSILQSAAATFHGRRPMDG